MTRISHILLDMDGVLCDFMGAALDVHGRRDALANWPQGVYDVAGTLGMSERDFWRLIDCRRFFWETIPPCPWHTDLIAEIEALRIPWTVATTPSRSAKSSSGKVRWLQSMFGGNFRRYMLGPQKYLLARPDTLLIDDCDANVEAFREAGGHAVLFPQPWNRVYAVVNPADKLEYVIGECRDICWQNLNPCGKYQCNCQRPHTLKITEVSS